LSIAALLGILVCPVTASADEKPASAYWMASVSNSDTVQWGRLVLKDGMLTFHTSLGEWKAPLYQIKRIVRVKDTKQTFEIVTSSGAALHLTILGPNMLPESPQKAMQVLQRAVSRATPPAAPVTSVAANAAGGGIRH
jgi:hypothetical protein